MDSVKVQAIPESSPAKKGIGLVDGVIFVLSCTIGSGLFFSPKESSQAVRDPLVALLAWVTAGLLSLAGSLVYSELGTSFVSAGAESTYLLKAFGPAMSFTFSWTMVTIIGPSACACISWVLGTYVIGIFGWGLSAGFFVALAVMISLCVVNLLNPKYVLMLNRFNVICKLLAVVTVVIACSVAFFSGTQADPFISKIDMGAADWKNFGSAVMFACFALSGWNMLNPLMEEMDDPGKDVPKIYTLGMLGTLFLAVLVCVAFYAGLSHQVMLNEDFTECLAKYLALALFSEGGGAQDAFRIILCILISFCCLGSCNGIMMGTSRCMQSNGRDGILPPSFSVSSKKHNVPYVSLIVFTTWTCLILVMLSLKPEGALKFIVNVYTVGQWTFFFLVGVSLFVLRYKYPDLKRPYKIHFYPLFPALFTLVAGFIVVMTFVDKYWYAAVSGVVIILIGTALFFASEVEVCRRIYFKITSVLPDFVQAASEDDSIPMKKITPVEG